MIELLIASIFFLDADPCAVSAAKVDGGIDQLLQNSLRLLYQCTGEPLQSGHLGTNISRVQIPSRKRAIGPQIEDLKTGFLDSDLHPLIIGFRVMEALIDLRQADERAK